MNPKALMLCDSWWHRPSLLHNPEADFLREGTFYNTEFELRKQKLVVAITQMEDAIINRYSSLTRLLRITAWMMRFYNRCYNKSKGVLNEEKSDTLTTSELNHALLIWVKSEQNKTFSEELISIKNQTKLSSKSKLSSLEPFIDTKGILRVGGRLQNANICFDQQHPIILHKNNRLSHLIVTYYHYGLLHGGGRLLDSNMRLKY